jgi:hypothetical protein
MEAEIEMCEKLKNREQIVNIHLMEYQKLKDEQLKRIAYRDSLFYIALVALGGLLSYSVSDTTQPEVLLLVPVICFVLGWTSAVNDHKTTKIGNYISGTLRKNIEAHFDVRLKVSNTFGLLAWEDEDVKGAGRFPRKFIQLVLNELVFVAPGLYVLLKKHQFDPNAGPSLLVVGAVLVALEVILGIYFVAYSDLLGRRA